MKRLVWLAAVLLLFGLPARGETRTFFAMDTAMTLHLPGAGAEVLDACEERVYALEKLLSVTDGGSEIYRLNAAGEGSLSPDTEALLRFALDMCAQTGGALDITLYPVLRAWGFTTGNYRVPAPEEIQALLAVVDFRRVTLEPGRACLAPGMMLDLGSVAKGYAADALAELLQAAGVDSGLLDLGGNIHCIGAKADGSPWRIAIRNPLGEGYCGVLAVKNCAVVTSGGYERYFEGPDGTRYGHILNPVTGCPVDNGLLSVTVVGESGAVCDALSTALYVMGLDAARAYLETRGDVEAVFVCEDRRVLVSGGLKGQFTLPESAGAWTLEWMETP